jgi:hypothetical protein
VSIRKNIAAALLVQLNSGGQFTGGTGRRLTNPEGVASPGKPALFLIKATEDYRREDRGTPPTRELKFIAVIYTDVGNDVTAVPADVIDDLLDAIDTALAPSPVAMMTNDQGRQTLGGLVYDCRIEGELQLGPGDEQGKGTTEVPITVVLNDYP